MRVIMILPHTRFTSYMHEGNFALIEDLAFDLVGIATLNREEAGSVCRGAPVYYYRELEPSMADLFVLPISFRLVEFRLLDVYRELLRQHNFPQEKLVLDGHLLKLFMMIKYKDSANPEIQNTLKYWETNDLDPFNQYLADAPNTYDEVFFDDKSNLPYIYFESLSGKRLKMYFPPKHHFVKKDGRLYVESLLREQMPSSPHLYTTDTHKPEEGDIIIDAGVCEGNFSLRYVDIASRFYLFENDPQWIKPLYQTFSQAGAKCMLIAKGVGDITNDKMTKIDDVIEHTRGGMNYFLKMDIEGFEVKALKGADKLLRSGRVKSSICTYHNMHDDIRISNILQKYGYKFKFSNGYMTIMYAPNMWQTRDFRRGVVYGDI